MSIGRLLRTNPDCKRWLAVPRHAWLDRNGTGFVLELTGAPAYNTAPMLMAARTARSWRPLSTSTGPSFSVDVPRPGRSAASVRLSIPIDAGSLPEATAVALYTERMAADLGVRPYRTRLIRRMPAEWTSNPDAGSFINESSTGCCWRGPSVVFGIDIRPDGLADWRRLDELVRRYNTIVKPLFTAACRIDAGTETGNYPSALPMLADVVLRSKPTAIDDRTLTTAYGVAAGFVRRLVDADLRIGGNGGVGLIELEVGRPEPER